MEFLIIGAIVGVVIGWLLLAILGPKGHFEAPNIWVIDKEGALGCFPQILILLVCAALGALGATLLAG